MMNLKFDRNELSGAFGDIGTDLPLLVGLTLASGLGASNVFFMFGLMQILSGAFYGLPMPVQPLKAVAIIAISQKLSGDIILGAGIAIGVIGEDELLSIRANADETEVEMRIFAND